MGGPSWTLTWTPQGALAFTGFAVGLYLVVALSLIVSLFVEPTERAKAMGVFGFVAAGGGSIGVLLGGVLTSLLDWHWIFLVNVPIGVAVCLLSLRFLPSAGAAVVSIMQPVLLVKNGLPRPPWVKAPPGVCCMSKAVWSSHSPPP